jgi:hypothetical protein
VAVAVAGTVRQISTIGSNTCNLLTFFKKVIKQLFYLHFSFV